MLLLPPRSTLFPYTTLFRSSLSDTNLPSAIRVRIQLAGDRAVDLRNQQPFEMIRSEEHTSELQSRQYLVCRLLLEKKNNSSTWLTRLFDPSKSPRIDPGNGP